MKKILAMLIAMLLAAALAGCKEKTNSNAKLLETITAESDGIVYTTKLDYDDKLRIVKKTHHRGGILTHTETVTYDGAGSVKIAYDNIEAEMTMEAHFAIEANTITVQRSDVSYGTEKLTVNKDGKITESITYPDPAYDEVRHIVHSYSGSNLIETKGVSGPGHTHELLEKYEYGDKKTSFYHCKTPKWLLQHLFLYTDASRNNVTKGNISHHHGEQINEYMYEYDTDGLPTRRTLTVKDLDGHFMHAETTRFVYRNTAKTNQSQ
ncbi:MAG: hypothetical protein LBU89_01105 [Fibromonadaceae bacterium]|jgi:hypothetical protein|nr:hypothetical protein [Fibromonadaceae bacterium]